MMSRQQRLIQLLLPGAALLCLLAGVGLAAWKRAKKGKKGEKAEAAGGVAKHTVETPADETLKYWTADKMRDARPAPMPHLDRPDQEKKRP